MEKGAGLMTTSEAVRSRRSVRAFLDRPVGRATIAAILETARFAPSGGNLQPWHVDALAGSALAELKAKAKAALAENPASEGTEFPIYPPALGEPWRSRRFITGEQLYESIGIPRGDHAARLGQFAKNYDLFGAPVGLFFSTERSFGPPQWAHLGMFIQTIMLLADEQGLGTCAQEAWARVPKTVGAFLNLPNERIFYCGMAVGYADEAHPINAWRTAREPLEGFASFTGFRT
jgi:nitroreductase